MMQAEILKTKAHRHPGMLEPHCESILPRWISQKIET